jgi:hypothetical protein
MKFKYIYVLLALVMICYLAPAYAQNKKDTKKAPAKKETKKPAATTTTATDTTKKSGANKNDQNNPDNLTEQIIVTTAYKPVLADAVKIRINPDLSDKTPFKAPLTYITLDKRLERNTDIHQLEAMKMPREVDSIPSNNYARIGVGNYKTTYGEAYIANGQDSSFQYGVFARHLAQSSSSINKQSEIKDQVGVFGRATTADNAFLGRINYSRLGTYFYGFDPANPPGAFNPAAQHFSTLSGEGEITKRFTDETNEFTYAVKVDGYLWNNAFHANEHNLVVTGFLNETINQFYAGLGASLDLSTQNDSLYSYNNSLLRLNPYLKFQGDFYKIDAGLNLVREFGKFSSPYVFPAVKAELQVIPKYLRLFADVKGDVEKASLRDFSEENPYIDQNINIVNTIDKLDLSIGLKGTIAPGLGFKMDVFHNSVKNLAMFANTTFTNINNKFSVIYDNGNSVVTGFNGELDFKASDDFDLFGRVEFKNYQMATEAEPWNLPKFKLTAGTVIHITNNLSINATLLYRGSTYDRTYTVPPLLGSLPVQHIVTISGFADLNGGVEYKLTDRLSIFGQVNNILNTTNQVWLYYPNYGFNIFGGVGYHF